MLQAFLSILFIFWYFIWYIPYLASILICLQSPDILVAILHSWVYLWRNQGNKRLYLPLSEADSQKTPPYNTYRDTFNRQPAKGSRSCLLAGFSSYFRLLKSHIPCHCAWYIIAPDFLEGIVSHELVKLMERRHWEKVEWNFRLLNQVLPLTI